ncbi:TetR/AcrR family transcriptional regulator [Microbispora corallina]|uniref:TetR family transcriptional regulator n=1 Tax=Microbispora corallina TaxID=83302 RepID=A0ABQ4G699_9ACTN|nr:TetR/AcrR family transcriptional regulator [Microbispora corallina]GIH42602.1 TetR family transcriptional regulator [Microbispora corallina]
MSPVPGQVKRRYDASGRREAAEANRRAILEAARELFTARGYAATTMNDIAERSGVALDTVYAAVGRKPALFLELVETALSGTDRAVPARQRGYVQAIRAEPDAGRKLEIYAQAIGEIHSRLAPLLRVAQTATHPEVREVWQDIAHRRAVNMRELAQDLVDTGQVRPGIDVDEIADVVWATNSPEFYCLLVEDRGWPAERFTAWLADTWRRLLIV